MLLTCLAQQKKIADPTKKVKLLRLTTQAVERLEQLKQRRDSSPSAPELGDLLDSMPSPPSVDPLKAPSKNPSHGSASTAKKFMGMHDFISII